MARCGYKFVCRFACAKRSNHWFGHSPRRALQLAREIKICNRGSARSVINLESAEKRAGKNKKGTYQTMKRNLLAVVAAGAIALGGFLIVQAQPGPGHGGFGGGHGHAFGLRGIADKLDLTSEQQTKVQPILDQAKPQLQAIHQEAMTKAKAVMDASVAQIRTLLTPDQQKKLDAIQKAHQDMMNARKELHDAIQE
jgi:Spy/CpxP family protein refolding chaperone